MGINDFFLALLLLFLSVDARRHWIALHNCSQPIGSWLLGTYALVASLRVFHLTKGVYALEDFDCIVPRRRLGSLLCAALAVWTAAGTLWTWRARSQSKQCLAESRHFVLVISWISVSYTWLFFQAFVSIMDWQHDRQLKWIKDNFRAVEDDDVISRWGNVSEQPGEACLSQGLTAEEITALPLKTATRGWTAKDQDFECSICLCPLALGDSIRPLDSCGHTFHRACIDLWLLRRAECPLCKTGVGERKLSQGLPWTV